MIINDIDQLDCMWSDTHSHLRLKLIGREEVLIYNHEIPSLPYKVDLGHKLKLNTIEDIRSSVKLLNILGFNIELRLKVKVHSIIYDSLKAIQGRKNLRYTYYSNTNELKLYERKGEDKYIVATYYIDNVFKEDSLIKVKRKGYISDLMSVFTSDMSSRELNKENIRVESQNDEEYFEDYKEG